jgi:PIN domain nuclease of toxin-antitoxin system
MSGCGRPLLQLLLCPADRLIVATALAHGLVLATHDQAIRSSGVITLWKGLRE